MVPPRDIVRRITGDTMSTSNVYPDGGGEEKTTITATATATTAAGNQSSRFSDFKDILLNMIHSYNEEFKTYDAILNMQTTDCYEQHIQKIWKNSRGILVNAKSGRRVTTGNGQIPITVIRPPSWTMPLMHMNENKRNNGGIRHESRLPIHDM